jgi:hypothetical protein
MEDSSSERINIFLTVDRSTINTYFNSHDPAPIYKRQLSHQLEEYIRTSTIMARRYSAVFYKFKCHSEIDKQYAQPLMYAIRRHYQGKKETREKEFNKFKSRSWLLLVISLVMVLVCQGFVPLMLDEDNRFHTAFGNSLDIFSWVLLWRPIDLLLFSWNPHLKDISLLSKLSTAELIILDNEK